VNFLVAGGAGFIGSHLCELLLDNDHSVICVDNYVTGTFDNVAHLESRPGFTVIEHDITAPLPQMLGIDGVLHLASVASPINYMKWPVETLKAGSYGTFALLDLAAANDAIFLLASTSEVYGEPAVHPQTEDYWGYVNPVGPRSVYDEAKRFAEAATMGYRRSQSVDTKIVRIFNTYGPRMASDDGRVIPALVSQALQGEPLTLFGDGSQTRSFCYISDLVEGIYRMLLSTELGPINLGNPTEMTVSELADSIVRLTGSRSAVVYQQLPQDDPTRRRPDISLATERLQWKPLVSFDDGLRRTIEWFREHGA
jgi:dTDP-glucose 4,6-dehydratase